MMAGKRILFTEFRVETSVYATLERQHNSMMREKQHKRCIRNQDENNALFRHIKATGYDIAWD